MRKILLIASVAFLASCGDKTEENQGLKLESFEDKLAYTLGATNARDLIGNQNFDATKLDMDFVLKGFKLSYNTTQPDCGKSIEGLLGAAGTDFNTEFLNDGSECIGRFLSFSLYSQLDGFDKASGIDTTLLFQGFQDGLTNADTLVLSVADQNGINTEFSEGIQVLIDEEMSKQWGDNKVTGENFLAENKLKSGVMTTATGLQYEIIKEGSGPKPTPANGVRVHYHGTNIDGSVFDSSIDRGEPIEFQVTGVIPGWTEALQLMSKGSKYRIYVPQELGYGAYPQPGGPIKPYSALIFDVELLEVL